MHIHSRLVDDFHITNKDIDLIFTELKNNQYEYLNELLALIEKYGSLYSEVEVLNKTEPTKREYFDIADIKVRIHRTNIKPILKEKLINIITN